MTYPIIFIKDIFAPSKAHEDLSKNSYEDQGALITDMVVAILMMTTAGCALGHVGYLANLSEITSISMTVAAGTVIVVDWVLFTFKKYNPDTPSDELPIEPLSEMSSENEETLVTGTQNTTSANISAVPVENNVKPLSTKKNKEKSLRNEILQLVDLQTEKPSAGTAAKISNTNRILNTLSALRKKSLYASRKNKPKFTVSAAQKRLKSLLQEVNMEKPQSKYRKLTRNPSISQQKEFQVDKE